LRNPTRVKHFHSSPPADQEKIVRPNQMCKPQQVAHPVSFRTSNFTAQDFKVNTFYKVEDFSRLWAPGKSRQKRCYNCY